MATSEDVNLAIDRPRPRRRPGARAAPAEVAVDPTDQQWLDVLAVFCDEPVRNRLMLAVAYDAALRREELCSLRTDDLDLGHRMVRARAETTKTRRGRAVPYSATTGVLLAAYLDHRVTISRSRGPLFLSEPRRSRAEPLSLWTRSKVVRRVALAAGVPQFSTHTTRHLCLTDLARMGWELLSNPARREPWRRHSVVAPAATGSIAGFGGEGYRLAIEAVASLLRLPRR